MERKGPDPESRNTHGFSTARLDIGVPDATDAEQMYALLAGPDGREVTAQLVWDGPNSLEEMLAWHRDAQSKPFVDFGFHWAIREKKKTQTIGAIVTRPRDQPGRADVGYWLGKPYWGHGLMKEALGGVLEYGFTELNYYKLEADVFRENIRGRRLVESAGMKEEGTVRRAFYKRGEFVDAVQYGILYEEWSG